METATVRRQLTRLRNLCRKWDGALKVIELAEFAFLFNAAPMYGPVALYGPRFPGRYNPEDDGYDTAPFRDNLGIHWKSKTIYVVRGHIDIGATIHEMGHCFADLNPPHSHSSDEWSWLGWEIATAKYVGAYKVWAHAMKNYGIGQTSEDLLKADSTGNSDWGDLSVAGQRKVAAERIAVAKRSKLVARNGRPLTIR